MIFQKSISLLILSIQRERNVSRFVRWMLGLYGDETLLVNGRWQVIPVDTRVLQEGLYYGRGNKKK